MFDQPAPDYWPDSGGDGTQARPRPDGASTFLLRKRTADDRETARHQQRRANSLGRAGSNELTDVGRESAPCRCQREQGDANQENAASSIVISERSADKQQRGEQE